MKGVNSVQKLACLKFIKYFAYSLEILIFYTIQRVPMTLTYTLLGIRPVYLIPIALVISVFEGKKVGMIFSIIVGIILDLESSFNLGFYTIALGTVAFMLGMLFEKTIKPNFITAVASVLLAMLLICILEFLFLFVFKGFREIWFALINLYLPKTFFTALTVPIFYFFNKTISNIPIDQKEQKVTNEGTR